MIEISNEIHLLEHFLFYQVANLYHLETLLLRNAIELLGAGLITDESTATPSRHVCFPTYLSLSRFLIEKYLIIYFLERSFNSQWNSKPFTILSLISFVSISLYSNTYSFICSTITFN